MTWAKLSDDFGDDCWEPPDEPPPDDLRGDHHQDDPAADGEDNTECAITYRLHVLRINQEARRRLAEETRPPTPMPAVKSLDALLAEPDAPTRYRINGVAPLGGRVMLSAPYKGGKTVLRDNLIRCLVDGDDFLGAFPVNVPAEHVVVLDDEMNPDTLRGWLRDQRITNTAAVADVVALRGQVSAFNPLDDRRRAQWAERLRSLGCDYLILDCLRPVLDALGLDENHDAGQFLSAFDTLLNDAGIADATVVQHMGHTGERARGDSRLEDWPDAIWRVARQDPADPSSPRYFSAFGRDVNVAEGRLSYDQATRRLTYAPGSRGDDQTEAATVAVVRLLAECGEPQSKSAIEEALNGEHKQAAIRAGIKKSVGRGVVTVATGPRGAKLHSIAYPCGKCGMPVPDQSPRHQSCPVNA